MEFTFKTEVNATKEKIWPYYSDPTRRYVWELDLENLVFNGEAKTGTTGIMKLKDMPEMQFEMIKVVDFESYWDKTDIPGMGSLLFGHDIIEEDGKTFIVHTVKLQKEIEEDKDLEFLRGVFADVPDAVMKIKDEVQK